MIVDDIPFVRQTIKKILTDADYEVVGEAENGLAAIELYKKVRPDLVTMDIVMPQMSGIDATRKMIAMDKNAKVVIISAMEQENLMMEAISAGAREYLFKPFSASDLVKTIDRIFAGDAEFVGHTLSKL